jgi:hypothetical protein
MWSAFGLSFLLGLGACLAGGLFSPPWPVEIIDWVYRIGGTVLAIFASMTIVFKQIIQPQLSKG